MMPETTKNNQKVSSRPEFIFSVLIIAVHIVIPITEKQDGAEGWSAACTTYESGCLTIRTYGASSNNVTHI